MSSPVTAMISSENGGASAALEMPEDMPAFALLSEGESLICEGIDRMLPRGGTSSLAARTAEFFAASSQQPMLLLGALPFDREQPDYLFQPRRVSRFAGRTDLARLLPCPPIPVPAAGSESQWSIVLQPSAAQFSEAVARAIELMTEPQHGTDAPRKVVLSRSLVVTTDQPVDPFTLGRHLARDRSVTTFVVPLPPAAGQPSYLVGATPELLIAKRGKRIESHPLAGSARRHRSMTADRASADALSRSDKDRREHLAVVEAILDTLAPCCSQLSAAAPALCSTASMWHLGTRITGELKDDTTPCTELLAALHPTPAVCGEPREWAQAAIKELESYDRGFYAGAVGWTDSAGDGTWYVSIRCAEIAGLQVRLYAGAGIVPGSDPASETQETTAKFAALLHALGIHKTLEETLEDVR